MRFRYWAGRCTNDFAATGSGGGGGGGGGGSGGNEDRRASFILTWRISERQSRPSVVGCMRSLAWQEGRGGGGGYVVYRVVRFIDGPTDEMPSLHEKIISRNKEIKFPLSLGTFVLDGN